MPEFFVVGLPRAIGPLYIPEGMSERGEGEAPLVPPSHSLARLLGSRLVFSLHVPVRPRVSAYCLNLVLVVCVPWTSLNSPVFSHRFPTTVEVAAKLYPQPALRLPTR